MKKPLDNFSKQASGYKKFRPTYPDALYTEILSHVAKKESCWDCGTGNGQVAKVLSQHFNQVYATDISEKQLALAPQQSNIIYKVERSEQTQFPDGVFDLITVAQAAHWFELEAFKKEVQRVSKGNGVIAIWGYGLLRIDPPIDAIIDDYYTRIIGQYWDKERKHVDNHYADIDLGLAAIPVNREFGIEIQWNLAELEGYFNTWSSLRHYLKEHEVNPVEALMKRIGKGWKKGAVKQIRFPVFMKMYRV